MELIPEKEINQKLENLKGKDRKFFLNAVEIINYVEHGSSVIHEPLLEEEVEVIKSICEDKENYEVLNEVKKVLDQRELMKVNTKVDFCGSEFIIVNRKGRYLDIKQNFSIGQIYEKVDISDVKLL
jgi:hypothetical protein